MLLVNKALIVVSTHGAAATIIDARTVDVSTNVLVNSDGGEFGRPAKGFTVNGSARRDAATNRLLGNGITVFDSSNVRVRGNLVVPPIPSLRSDGAGVTVVGTAPNRIEGNLVTGWGAGISSGSAAVVSRNQVAGNGIGIKARGGRVSANSVVANSIGISIDGPVEVGGNQVMANVGSGILVSELSSGAVVSGNNLHGHVFSSQSCGLKSLLAGLVATNNYWGHPAGPGGGASADLLCGPGVTTPFATQPFPVSVLKP
jgi:hypothetical protein